jgi:filamentous hemagglutinin family protein
MKLLNSASYQPYFSWASLLKKMCFLAPFFIVSVSYANPVLNTVVSGNVSVQQSANETKVVQTTQQGIVEWNSFNIGANQKTQFIQPNGNAITLNRIDAHQGVSQILGQLQANGKIILVNGAGIYFGSSAVINVGSIIATTSDISNASFLNGKFVFDRPSTYGGASVINKGRITAAEDGVVALLGGNVSNDGTIIAHLGTIALGAGSKFTVDFGGDQLVTFTVDAPVTKGGVSNTGKLLANGGQIIVTAEAAQSVLDNVINMSGIAEADSYKQHGGTIILSGGNGNVSVTGKISASSRKNSSAPAGNIHITGNNIALGKNSVVVADAGKTGAGGNIVVKASHQLAANGAVSAKGGSTTGNGGSVETSGALVNVSSIKIDLTAAHGKTGIWLIDPSDLTISSNAGSNTPTISNINVADLVNALATANVVVQTTVSGSGGLGDIIVMNNVNWAAATTLTLTAYHDVVINNGVSITNSNGGTLTLRADNTGTGNGTVLFNGSGKVNFSAGGNVNIYYNPSSYTSPTDYTSFVTGVTPTAFMLVNNASDLTKLNTNLSGNYALGNNLTLTTNNFTPIGNVTTPYSGSFDGQGFTISGLTISDTTPHANLGLFGYTANANIANINLANVTINETAEASNIGSLIGSAVNTKIKNATVGGTNSIQVAADLTTNSSYIGGLVGYLNGGSIDNSNLSNFTITVSGTNYGSSSNIASVASYAVGGLAGAIHSAVVSNSYVVNSSLSDAVHVVTADGTKARNDVGGFIGSVTGASTLDNNYSDIAISYTGNVTSPGTGSAQTNVAGLLGSLEGTSTLSNSYSFGAITSTSIVSSSAHGASSLVTAGLVATMGSNAAIKSDYSASHVTSNVTATNIPNGKAEILTSALVGRNSGAISDVYTTGEVSTTLNADASAVDFCSNVGGIAATNTGSINNAQSADAITLSGITFSGDVNVGGVVGGQINRPGSEIANSFSTGTIDTSGYVTTTGTTSVNDFTGNGNPGTTALVTPLTFSQFNALTDSVFNANIAMTVEPATQSVIVSQAPANTPAINPELDQINPPVSQNVKDLLASYTSYVGNLPETQPMPTYVNENVVVVAASSGDCSASPNSVTVNAQGEIAMSESCAP